MLKYDFKKIGAAARRIQIILEVKLFITFQAFRRELRDWSAEYVLLNRLKLLICIQNRVKNCIYQDRIVRTIFYAD